MSENKSVDVDVNNLDNMFLAMLLLDPQGALKSYGVKASKDVLIALENAVEGEREHWREVVKEVAGARGDFCNWCDEK